MDKFELCHKIDVILIPKGASLVSLINMTKGDLEKLLKVLEDDKL